MCIAIVKPKGVKMPSKDILKRCWENNPDGAGFCYNDGSKVVIHKGYMTFNSLYNALKHYADIKHFDNKDVAIHFRISTSGGVKPENTHPFAVSTRMKDLTKSFTKCKDAFIHNGIINGYGNKQYSDTMEYVTNIIANIKDLDHSSKLIDSLADIENSRFAVITRNSYILGGGWLKDNGLFFSNSSYRPRVYYTTKNYSNFDLFKKPDACEWCYNNCTPDELHLIYDRDTKEYDYICDGCYDFYKDVLKHSFSK